jgi:hypothetical protein
MTDTLVYNGSASVYNFIIDQGATWELEVQVLEPDDDPLDLTGFSAAMQLRSDYGSEPAYLTLESPSNGIVITPLEGKLRLTASAVQTLNLSAGLYVYDIEIYSGSFIQRILQGTVTVNGEVTNV